MTITSTSTRELHARLDGLYTKGCYRELIREGGATEIPVDLDPAVSLDLGRALLLVGSAHLRLNDFAAAEERLLLAMRLLGSEANRSHPAYFHGLEELGYLHELMGRYPQAESLYRRALEQHARNPDADPEGHARCLQCLSDLLGLLWRRREAVDLLRQAQSIREQALGKNHLEYARGLLAEAWIGFRVGRTLSCEEQVRKALPILRASQGEQHPEYATTLQTVARVLLAFDHIDEAERLLNQTRDLRRQTLGEEHPSFASTLEALAWVKLSRGRPTEAEALSRRAVEIERAALGENHPDVAWGLGTLGCTLRAGWKFTEAEECHRLANQITRAALGESYPGAADNLNDLAATLWQGGKLREAEELLREVVMLLEQSGGDVASERIAAKVELGRFLFEQGDNDEAERLVSQALDEAVSFAADDPFVVVPARLLSARMLENEGKLDRALTEIRRADATVESLAAHQSTKLDVEYARMEYDSNLGDFPGAIRRGMACARAIANALGESHPNHANLLRYLGELYHQAGDYEESERQFEESLSQLRRHHGSEHPEVADALGGLARLHLSRNNSSAAESRFKQAVEIRRAVLGEQHPAYAESLKDLAELYSRTGNFLAADTYYRQALDVLRVNPGENHPNYALALQGQANVLHAAGDLAQAEALLEQALRILRADLENPHRLHLGVKHSLALVHFSRFAFFRAEELLSEVLAGYERVLGKDHEDLIPVLADLNRLYEATGDLEASGPVGERIRSIHTSAGGANRPERAFDLVGASNHARLRGDLDQAESHAREALSLATRLLPVDHPALVEFLRPLALVCQARKGYHEAEELLLRALNLTVAAFGSRNPLVALREGDLGSLYAVMQRHQEASRRFESAANLIRETRGEDHADHANARHMLGLYYQSRKEFDLAEKSLRKALEVTRRTAGEHNPAVASAHQALAELYRYRNDLSRSATEYRNALDVLRMSEQPCDALHATLLHGKALTLLQQGLGREAEPLLRAALDIDQTEGDHDTLGHLESVLVLGQLHAAEGRDAEAMGLLRKVMESNLRLSSDFCCLKHDGSPVRFWAQNWDLCEMLITLTARSPASSSATRFLFDLVLRFKGLGPFGMVLAGKQEMLRKHPQLRAKLDTRFALGTQTAWRAIAGAGFEGFEVHRKLLGRWQERRESLEQELEARVPSLALQRRWLTADAKAIALVVPEDTALIEYVRYRPRDFASLQSGKENPLPVRYLAFVLPGRRPDDIRMADLGEAETIDQLARSACALFGGRQAQTSLVERIVSPLTLLSEGFKNWVVAASGPLAPVPFPKLSDSMTVTRQMTCARELLDLPATSDVEERGWLARLFGWK